MKKIPILDMNIEKIDYRKLLPLQGAVRWLPEEGYERLKNSFSSEGMCLPFFVWKKGESYFILDGHGREKLFKKEDATFEDSYGNETHEVPCIVVEAVDEQDARKKILLINSNYQQWTTNKEEINQFINKIDLNWINEATNIPQLSLPDLKLSELFLPEQPEFEEAESIFELKSNPLFERGVNAYDIPLLRKEMICEIPSPIETWTGEERNNYFLFLQGHSTKGLDCTKAVLCFYSWDDHFEGLWTKLLGWTEKIKHSKYHCVISPNYTITGEDPVAFKLWQIYRTRYITRYWQEAGIKVIPDVIWADKKSLDYVFLGIPENCTCVSLQMQNLHNIKAFEEGFLEMLKVVKPLSIFAYCPIEKRYILEKNVKDNIKIVYAEPWINLRRKSIENK